MAGYYSPHATPAQEFPDERYERYNSPGYIPTPSATPSPRAPYYSAHPFPAAQTPQRPATRSHFRHPSTGYEAGNFSPRQTISPRFTSGGQYATGDPNVSSTRKHFWSSTSSPSPARSKNERRSSFSYRTSTPHGESDEDEYNEADGVAYVIPAKPRARRMSNVIYVSRGHGTDHHRYEQFAFPDDERKTYPRHSGHGAAPPPAAAAAATPTRPVPHRYSETPAPDGARRSSHARRSSAAAHPIQRPQTVRPEASRRAEPTTTSSRRPPAEAAARHHSSKKAHAPSAMKATEEDAKRCGIPPGYSLKNWDPSEEPILLLGSVFDSNSLGKWIYDWTVFSHGSNTPLAEEAGELWLLLIQLAGKTKRAMRAVPAVRRSDNKETLEDFIDAGERLTDKLRDLLVNCEQPMLEASKKGNKAKLGKGAGVEFINTLFGRDRMLQQTEKFMQSIRLWNLRYDANVEDILKEPTK
ncbi:putative vegetative cell wall protein gp1 protein [Zalerion maritima]|uniref:Vegetative cell wall protein gp1 protein n=1 Tax=Zalerion maritima TaxID=339359 RepID=A0AAD5WTP2_9PEZI|nr:putative vegetative cell wall protein gp1 protein [Zalerion maritima]